MRNPRLSFRALAWACAGFLALMPGHVYAQEAPAVTVTPKGSYVRILFQWKGQARAQASLSNDVVVVRFEEPQIIDAEAIGRQLASVASLVRPDTDGRALRIALQKPARLKTSASGRRFALDLIGAGAASDPAPIDDPKSVDVEPANVRLTVSERQTFTRLGFEWGGKTGYRTSFKSGTVTITFDRPGSIDLKRFNAAPPAWVRSASAQETDKALIVRLEVDPEARVTDRLDGTRVVIDVAEPRMDADEKKPASREDSEEQPPPPPQLALADTDVPEGDRPRVSPEAPADPKPMVLDGSAPVKPKGDEKSKSVASDAQALAEAGEHKEKAVEGAQGAATTPSGPLELRQTAQDLDLAPLQAVEAAVPPAAPGKLVAEIFGPNVKLTFPFKSLPAAAIFRRGKALWVLFKSTAPMDLSALEAVRGGGVSLLSQPQAVAPGVTAMRLAITDGLLAGAVAQGQQWEITVGPGLLGLPGQIPILRQVAEGGPSSVRALLPGAEDIVWIKDPDLGEHLAVVLAQGPAKGVRSAMRFVEFKVLETLHGLALQTTLDDLTVAKAEAGVHVSRPAGLLLSMDPVPRDVAASLASDDLLPDFATWAQSPHKDEHKGASALLRASAESAGGLTPERLALARYYVANSLGAEALGVIRLMVAQDPEADNKAELRLLRSYANLQTRRHQEAIADLNHHKLIGDTHAGIVRGLAHAALGSWADALKNLQPAERVLARYPQDWQNRVRIALAEAAQATKSEEAERAISALPEDLPKAQAAQVSLLRGRQAERAGDNDAALSAYESAVRTQSPPVAIQAEIAAALLKAKLAKIQPEEAIETLERARYRWRGDAVERDSLHQLGLLYVDAGRVREGLDAMQSAVRYFPGDEQTRAIQADMQKAFADLFLLGKGDKLPPIKALGLFYDFKELTPVGPDGDEMIRKLSDRLVSVDLLDQAAGLLKHQVENRLEGIARAQIAGRLALVQLMARKPEEALATLRNSRQARLPDELIDQRRLLEARALSDLKRSDEALELLGDSGTNEALRLRADVLWEAQRWGEAARSAEDLAGDTWKSADALSEPARRDVLRAAIAYTLAGEEPALARLRERFGAKMREGPDARSFTVIANQADTGATDLRQLVGSVASIDTLEGFLADFRAKYGGPPAPAKDTPSQ